MRVFPRLMLVAGVTLSSATVPAAAQDWSGLYFGLQGGFANGDSSWGDVDLTGESIGGSPSGVAGGAHLGFNAQFGSFLVGIEGQASLADASGSDGSVVPSVSFSTEIDRIYTIAARAGWAHQQWLLFGKAGAAIVHTEASGRDGASGDSFSNEEWLEGAVYGVGFDYRIHPGFTVGIEYNYFDLPTEAVMSGVTRQGVPYQISDYTADLQTIMLRVSYQLGSREREASPLK